MEERVLEVVRDLVSELGGGARRSPGLDDVLDRDLGISSLERVELLLRLEQAFGVRLPDAVMADAETVRSLVEAVRLAAPSRGAEPAAISTESLEPALAAPTSAQSLTDVLRWHADRSPDRVHIYLRGEDGSERPITYGKLLTDAKRVAAGLIARAVAPDEPVVLMLRTEEAFFAAFFGALLARAIPVPIYPPVRADQLPDYIHRQKAIVTNARARVLITFAEAERAAALIQAQVPSLEAVTSTASLQIDGDVALHAPPDAPALIQYTSGSTGSPKGVLLSHANLLANVRAIGQGFGVDPHDVCVSWLPLYHDMGLIGAWLTPLYFGLPIAIMSPLAFLSRPSRWLRAIQAHKGTVSAAPNFAYDLAARKIPDEELEGLDLRSWRLALNGSEPVSPDTIDRFTRRFAPFGFKPEAMSPVYGLAESSVGLTMPVPGAAPRVDRISRAPFERSRILEPASADDPQPLRFVSCGRPLPGHDVRIVDDSDTELADRREGHVQFRGPSMTRGYYRNPEATAALMHDGWLDSGDFGYWSNGDLFITGRAKDVIIQGGRNVSAQEIEEIVAAVPGIRRGCVAAFGVHDPAVGTERLVVVAETRDRDQTHWPALQQAVIEQVVASLSTPPDVVVIAPPGTVLKTSSGKIRRSATRDAHVAGTLHRRRSRVRQWSSLARDAVGGQFARARRQAARIAFTVRVVAAAASTIPFLWVALLFTSGASARRAARSWSKAMLRLSGVKVAVKGLDHLRGFEAGLLAANHASYVDPILLMATLPLDVHFVAKRRLADYPIIGAVIRRGGYLTIEKSATADRLAGADEVVGRLKEGQTLVVFPEGTFDRRARLLPFRLGTFRAAVETGRPVVPIALRGTRATLPDGTWMFSRSDLAVIVNAPLVPERDGWPEMVRLRDATRDAIARDCGEPPG